MTNLLRRAVVLVLGLAVTFSGFVAVRAEVAAEVDFTGQYVRTVILSRFAVTSVKIWTVFMESPVLVPLNPDGDLQGDLWPVIGEDPTGKPWVVWSRFNGYDYDLAWTSWGNSAWDEIGWLENAPRAGDDVDPDLTFDANGRPHVTWWCDEGGIGRVYFSMFLDTRWMTAYGVSESAEDSRDPTIEVNDDGSITVEYMTPAGPRSRTLYVMEGHSIQDDFDPFGSLSSKNMSQ